MRKRLHHVSALFIAALTVFTIAACSSSTSSSEDPMSLANSLLDEYGNAVFERDPDALASLLSDAFILRRADGTGYDKQGFVDALSADADYRLVSYEIVDVAAQRDGAILVVEYTFDGVIEEDGRQVTTEPSRSLATFVEVDGEWKLVSDAFFIK